MTLRMSVVVTLLTAWITSQQALSGKPPATVVLGQTTLHLGMRRAEVVALLAPKYEIRPDGMVVSKEGPPYEFIGTVGFSDEGLLRYVNRDSEASTTRRKSAGANRCDNRTNADERSSANWIGATTTSSPVGFRKSSGPGSPRIGSQNWRSSMRIGRASNSHDRSRPQRPRRF
jgi:hypothetical protein